MPEETTPSLWADVNALKKEISLSEKERSKQRLKTILNEIEGCAKEELARFERIIMERRGRAAVPAIVAPIGTALAQPSSPRSRCSGISFYIFRSRVSRPMAMTGHVGATWGGSFWRV